MSSFICIRLLCAYLILHNFHPRLPSLIYPIPTTSPTTTMAPQMPGLLKREKSFLDKTAFNFPSFTTKGLFDHVEHDLIATVGEFIGTVGLVGPMLE